MQRSKAIRGLWLLTAVGCGQTDSGPRAGMDGGADAATTGATDAGANAADDGGASGEMDGSNAGGDDGGPGDWWRPSSGTSWQWQLSGTLDTSLDVAMYDVDLVEVSEADLRMLRDAGRRVICYFSAGTVESYRDDAGEFEAADIGKVLPEWPDEKWLDIRSTNVRRVMQARLDLAVSRGCDGVEPDNVDGYANDNGLALSEEDQLDYNRFLATEAHARGLSVGLKNSVDLVEALEPAFDWALNEECFNYDECQTLRPFIDANKAVFHVEYLDDFADAPSKSDAVCGAASVAGFSTLIKTWDLGPERLACP